MKQLILVIDDDPEALAFLEDYFGDTRSEVLAQDSQKDWRESFKLNPRFLFIDPAKLSVPSRQQVEKFLAADNRYVFVLGNSDDKNFSLADSSRVHILFKPLDLVAFEEGLFKALVFPDKLRVLVIDDEMEVCSGIKEFLEFRRAPAFEVDFALNGLEGFRKIESFKPDVTILDIKMPVKSGHDLYREVQKKYRDLRVIILTAAAGADEIEEIRKLGSPPFVEKGGQRSGFPGLLTLIKKQWAFS